MKLLRSLYTLLFGDDPLEQKKVLLLGLSFFVAIGSYTLAKELKDSVFMQIVGYEYVPAAKFWSIFVLIPLVFLYSRMVDLLKRHQVLMLVSLIYTFGGLICAYYFGHPTIGLGNTDQGADRWFGWIFYFFVEGYSPFLVSVIWAFVNSVMKPDSVKSSYVTLTAMKLLGGMVTALGAWYFLTYQCVGACMISDVASYQVLMVVAALLLSLIPLFCFILVRVVPKNHLHGYEKAYQYEKRQQKIHDQVGQKTSFWDVLSGMGSGIYVLVRYPYVFGIFLLSFFWEVVNVSFNYVRLGVGKDIAAGSVAKLGAYLFGQIFFVQFAGFVVVVVGARTLVSHLGVRKSLMVIPLVTGGIILAYLWLDGFLSIGVAYIVMRAVNYGIAGPLRESLYIPTTKATKFKAKTWIDGFGAKLAKASGSGYNIFTAFVLNNGYVSAFTLHSIFFGGVIGVWTLIASLMGAVYERTVKEGGVIGASE